MKKLLMIIPLVFLLCFTFGCQDREALAELEEFKAQAALEEQNKEVVKQIMAEIDNNNLESLDELCTTDYKMYFPSRSNPIGLEEHKQLLQVVDIGFPDHKHTPIQFIVEGDSVAVRYKWEGTHKGEYSGIPPTGKKIDMSIIGIWRFSNGKVVEFWADMDILGMMQELGMELKPKEGEK